MKRLVRRRRRRRPGAALFVVPTASAEATGSHRADCNTSL